MKPGSIRIEGNRLIIEAPPHVSIRLRRNFGGIQRYKAGVFQLSATPEQAYDLEWFRQRYPLTVDPASEAKFRTLCAEHERKLEAIAAIDVEGYIPREFDLALPPREYQRIGAELAIKTGGLLIADDLGVGKTITAICALTAPGSLPALVITLTHLTRQWERELARFAPALRVHRIRKGQPYAFSDIRVEVDPLTKRRKVVKHNGVPDVILINYHKLHGWVESLAGVARTVVMDEAQEFRHSGTKKYDAGKMIAQEADLRIGLSVGPSTRVELSGGPFGTGWSGPIEEAWGRLSAGSAVEEGKYEIIKISDEVMSRGWISDEHGFGWKPVKTAIRHRATKPMLRVHAAGVRTDMTVDHSVFTATATELREVPTGDLKIGDIIPCDDGAWWQCGREQAFDTLSLAADVPQSQVTVDLAGVTRQQLGLLAWEWQNCHMESTYGTRVPIQVYLKHRWLRTTGKVYVGRGKAPQLPLELKLSSWAYILGFFLGDGWSDGNRVAFSVDQPRVASIVQELIGMGLGLRPEIREMTHCKMSEVRVSHVLLARLLKRVTFGAKCQTKRIPHDWIFTWDTEARHELLHGLIDSDGHRAERASAMCYTTTSVGLADDVRILLRSLGAASTVHTSPPSKGGRVAGRQIEGKWPRISVSWSDNAAQGIDDGHKGGRHRFDRWRDMINEAPVRSVSDVDVDPESYVYDLEMDGHPSFVANGMLCHNTATPIYNYGVEIFNVIDVIAPDQLGTRKEFLDEWCGGVSGDMRESDINKARVTNPAALGTYLRESGLMIRRTRKDVGREIPALTIVKHAVECDPASIYKATQDVAELAKRVLNRIGTPLERMQSAGELDYRLRLATGIAKAGAVADFVRLLVDAGEKVVLFGWHHAVYEIWCDAFDRPGAEIPFALFTGKESDAQKDAARKKFVEGDAKVLIMSLRAGAGLDGLQFVCRTVVIGELDWSPGVLHQDFGRVHRDGQTEPVMGYVLVADEGSDPVISDVLGIKEAQAAGIRDPETAEEAVLTGASDDHIRKLAESVLKRRGVNVDN